jgi:hypothetical protein
LAFIRKNKDELHFFLPLKKNVIKAIFLLAFLKKSIILVMESICCFYKESNMFNIVLKIVFFLCILGIGVNNSFATILVSGDVDIVYPINPAFPDIQLEGNQRFFLNILQGSQNVAVVEKQADLSVWNPLTDEELAQDLNSINDEEIAVNGINSFYNDNAITSSVINNVTASALENVGLLVVPLPGSNFSPEELSIMNSYITNGGSVFFLGDAFDHPKQNSNINLALLGLGSTLSIAEYSGLDFYDGGPFFATGDQISNNVFTSGIESFIYGYVSEIKGDPGRLVPLFYTQESAVQDDGTPTGVVPFIAYEQPLSVPEPSTIAFLFISLPALFLSIRKRKK